jgi:epsilon-lactone hydrolase
MSDTQPRVAQDITEGQCMASKQAMEFAEFLADLGRRSSNPNFELPMVRDVTENIHQAAKEPEGVTYAEVDAGGVEALWCIPVDSDPDTVLLHSHLGGSVLMSMHTDRKAAAHIAKAAGARSLVPDFRRSPEHKYPAQVDDIETAYRWLLEQGYQPSKIASVGHSVGGYLAVQLALRLRDRGEALPGAVLSISPWTDITLSGESIEANADRDKLLTRGLLELFRSCWLDGTGVDFTDPQVHLLNANLSGLPPTAVYYGEYELLASEAVDFARRAQEAGNDIVLRRVDEGQHSFIMGAGCVPEVDGAITEMGSWLRTTLALDATDT